jgi:hypothetical protein
MCVAARGQDDAAWPRPWRSAEANWRLGRTNRFRDPSPDHGFEADHDQWLKLSLNLNYQVVWYAAA